jgi:hypothetical protein
MFQQSCAKMQRALLQSSDLNGEMSKAPGAIRKRGGNPAIDADSGCRQTRRVGKRDLAQKRHIPGAKLSGNRRRFDPPSRSAMTAKSNLTQLQEPQMSTT